MSLAGNTAEVDIPHAPDRGRDENRAAADAAGVDSYADLLGQLQCLAGPPSSVELLAGGLTNTNLKVRASDGRLLVVRIAAANAGLLSIDRENEYHNTLLAGEAGVGARVVEYRPELGVLVVELIAAVTLDAPKLRRGEHLERIAGACRLLHGGPRFKNDFNMFKLQRFYLSIVTEHGYRLPERYVDFMPTVSRIEAALSVLDEGTVPCNNDLLAENILDDGERIWLIDYEYSGNNDACFELGNIWSESDLSLEQLEELVEAYYGQPRPEKVARARLQGLMSKYGWTLWASIQASAAEIDFDFWSWGMDKYNRAVAEFDSPGLGALLDKAAGL